MSKLLNKKPEEMTLKQLEKIKSDCFHEIQERRDLEREKEFKKYVGKYYKYKNSYSCPQTEEDYWWTYTYVKELKDNGLIVFSVQTDKYGKITIEDNNNIGSLTGHIESNEDEFYFNLRMTVEDCFLQNVMMVED